EGVELTSEVTDRVDRQAGQGALRAGERSRGERVAEVLQVAVDEVQLVGGELSEQTREDGRHLVERDQRDRVRVGSQHLAELRGEAGVTRVVRGRGDDRATGGLEGLRDVLRQAG